ncbi:hypothetical protein [Natronococcus occultus]|uniref:hypothetical protein n=1 Tax=Natronococcus occultus TaxID=29288 RepID=UPI0012F7C69C|nr:hypothetical protein [Natronococcus occultus]
MIDLLADYWNDALTLVLGLSTLVIGYYQVQHLRSQRPDVDVGNLDNFTWYEYAGDKFSIRLDAEVQNGGGRATTINGAEIYFEQPKWRIPPRYWYRFRSPRHTHTLDISRTELDVGGVTGLYGDESGDIPEESALDPGSNCGAVLRIDTVEGPCYYRLEASYVGDSERPSNQYQVR